MFTIEAYCSLTLQMTAPGKFQCGKNDNISHAEFFLHRMRFLIVIFEGYELLSGQPKMHKSQSTNE